jgi:DNA-binding response OmpR family regulator
MKILVVEDERALAESICQYLGSEHFQCELATDFKTARDHIEGQDYDCIILDIGLPGGSGLHLLAELKNENKAEGVLIISAKNSLDDRVQGLRMGADDYLTKPFHLSELSARVEAIIRRKSFDGATTLHFDMLTLDLSLKTLQVGDMTVELTRKEYDLLLYFISNRTKVISKTALADHLWADMAQGQGTYDFIYTHIKNIRRKLMAAGSPDYIQSVYGMGYKLRIP